MDNIPRQDLPTKPAAAARQAETIDRLLDFIREREFIRLHRVIGEPWPWTDNLILRKVGLFTNIHREDDRVTKWIAKHWRNPNADEPDLWFAMVVARFVNWPDTLAKIGFPVPWDRNQFLAVAAAIKRRGEQWESAAYMIRADPRTQAGPRPNI